MCAFKSILFVITGNDAQDKIARERVISLVQKTGAQLTIASVLKEMPAVEMMRVAGRSVGLQEPDALEQRAQLEQFASSISSTGIPARTRLLSGEPVTEITEEVIRNHHDLVMTTVDREDNLLGRLFNRELAVQLMRKCPGAVWVTNPESPVRSTNRMLVAVGGATFADERVNALNRKVMRCAISLAEVEKSELHVVHCWKLYGESILWSSRFRQYRHEVLRTALQIREHHQNWLDKVLQRDEMSGIKHHVHLIYGVPGRLIPSLAQALHVDLIVMGMEGRSGLKGLIVGNTAEAVLREVDCSVLTIKPDHFEAPIKISE